MAKEKKVEAKIEESPQPEEGTKGPRWIKVTPEQLMKLQDEGKLVGWNPEKGEALCK